MNTKWGRDVLARTTGRVGAVSLEAIDAHESDAHEALNLEFVYVRNEKLWSAHRMSLQLDTHRAEVVDRLARTFACEQCGGRAGPKTVAMWRSLAMTLSEDIPVGLEPILRQRMEQFLHA